MKCELRHWLPQPLNALTPWSSPGWETGHLEAVRLQGAGLCLCSGVGHGGHVAPDDRGEGRTSRKSEPEVGRPRPRLPDSTTHRSRPSLPSTASSAGKAPSPKEQRGGN